jgi:hypothetical protein
VLKTAPAKKTPSLLEQLAKLKSKQTEGDGEDLGVLDLPWIDEALGGAGGDVNVIDLTGTDRGEQPKPHHTDCVIIGYIPDPDNPGAIGQLVLGIREEDGTIRYAGTVSQFAQADDVGPVLEQVPKLKPLLDRPAYLPRDLKVVAVEPTVNCRVRYRERTGEGVLKDVVVTGAATAKPAAENPPK